MKTLEKDIKELARLYRESALSRFNKGCVKKDSTDNSNNMKVYCIHDYKT